MKNKKLQIVLDTNIILASVYKNSKYHIIFEKLIGGEYDLFLTNDILLEYEEKLTSIFGHLVAKQTIELLLTLDNVFRIETFFNLGIIQADFDDNKFVDCAFVCNADYIVTNDKHFNILESINFPKINAINISKFIEIIK